MANNTPPGEGGDDLAEFRNQWKKELTVKTGDAAGDNLQEAANRDDGQDQDDDVHRKARDFFMQGVEFEQSGLLYEAIRFYKKAEKLVPNIEHYAHKFNGGLEADLREDVGTRPPQPEASLSVLEGSVPF